MKNNCVSIEVAKELYELGWRRVGIFVYDNEEKTENIQGNQYFKGEYKLKELRDIKRMHEDIIPAPQLHEILDLLPYIIKKDDGAKYSFYYLHMDEEMDKRYRFVYENIIYGLFGRSDWNENPHDAAAKLLIWCIKNKFVTL